MTALTAASTLPQCHQWIGDLLAEHPELAATIWRLTVVAGLVSVEASGGFPAATLWHTLVGGRMDPAPTNAAGIRRQHITGRYITVEIVDQTNSTRTGRPLVAS